MKKNFNTTIAIVMLLAFTACGGGGSDGSGGASETNTTTQSDIQPIAENNFESDVTQEGSLDNGGSYSASYFNNADPARCQLVNNSIPKIIGGSGKYYILDITQWPAGWVVGKVVVVRRAGGVIEYKRLIMRVEQTDGRFAMVAEDATVLDTVNNAQIASTGGSSQPASALSTNKAMVYQPAAIVNYGFNHQMDIRLNPEPLYLINTDNASLTMEPELRGQANIEFEMIINTPTGLTDLVNVPTDFVIQVIETTENLLNDMGMGAIIGAGDGTIVAGISAETARDFAERISTATEIVDLISNIHHILANPERIQRIYVSVDGELAGSIGLTAIATAKYDDSYETPSLFVLPIPISGPFPLYLTFDLVGVVDTTFMGRFQATTGATVTLPLGFVFEVANGSVSQMGLTGSSMEPSVNFPTPPLDLTGTQAAFTMSAGLQIECGISVPYLASASIDPTLAMVLESDVSIEDGTCIIFDWDLFTRFDIEAEADFLGANFPFGRFAEFTLREDEAPMDVYRYCAVPEPDSDNDGVPDIEDMCPDTPDGVQVDANGCPIIIEPTYTLSVSNPGVAGYIWSQSVGISCGYGASECSQVYDAGTTVRLSVNDDNEAGYIFTGWSGACSGTGDCVVTMTSNKSVTANFVSEPELTPPEPDLLSVNVPFSVNVGEPFTVTVSATNNGGASPEGAINASIADKYGEEPDFNLSGPIASWADGRYSRVPDNDTIYDSNCDPMTAKYHMLEAVDSNWQNGETHTMSFTVTPNKVGTLVVWVRTTMRSDSAGECPYYNDTSASGGIIMDDQQGWPARLYEVTVTEPTYTLSVFKTGSGTIGSTDGGIYCGSDCSESYIQGTPVYLSADPSDGYTFSGWSGACSGTGTCAVTMTSDRSVTANFISEPEPTYTLSVTNPGAAGYIWSQLVGISCGYGATDCSKVYDAGTTVRLSVNDDDAAGYIFTGWSGACSGTGDCVVTMTSNRSVTANFYHE